MDKATESGICEAGEKRKATREELLQYVEEDRQHLVEAKANLPRVKRKELLQCVATLTFVFLLWGFNWRWLSERTGWDALYRVVGICFFLILPVWRARSMIQGARKRIEFAREMLADSLEDAGLPQEELLVNGVEHGK